MWLRYRDVGETKLEFGAGGGHFEHLWLLIQNTITVSVFICELWASKVCIHFLDTSYVSIWWCRVILENLITTQMFIETEGWLRYSRVVGLYPEVHEASPHDNDFYFFQIIFNIILKSTPSSPSKLHPLGYYRQRFQAHIYYKKINCNMLQPLTKQQPYSILFSMSLFINLLLTFLPLSASIPLFLPYSSFCVVNWVCS
jgi:hypothetical protein